jgi:hypothetical protein
MPPTILEIWGLRKTETFFISPAPQLAVVPHHFPLMPFAAFQSL